MRTSPLLSCAMDGWFLEALQLFSRQGSILLSQNSLSRWRYHVRLAGATSTRSSRAWKTVEFGRQLFATLPCVPEVAYHSLHWPRTSSVQLPRGWEGLWGQCCHCEQFLASILLGHLSLAPLHLGLWRTRGAQTRLSDSARHTNEFFCLFLVAASTALSLRRGGAVIMVATIFFTRCLL